MVTVTGQNQKKHCKLAEIYKTTISRQIKKKELITTYVKRNRSPLKKMRKNKEKKPQQTFFIVSGAEVTIFKEKRLDHVTKF